MFTISSAICKMMSAGISLEDSFNDEIQDKEDEGVCARSASRRVGVSGDEWSAVGEYAQEVFMSYTTFHPMTIIVQDTPGKRAQHFLFDYIMLCPQLVRGGHTMFRKMWIRRDDILAIDEEDPNTQDHPEEEEEEEPNPDGEQEPPYGWY
ncbi:hypothetical protein K466DRAFT_570977 [Polyporus arcularius HHB13444]|uniref:Uncharacterized protein n=1 Tax=Polyporus arcularius HHB13444 TaxID=1314778 RepID=A0A5C3NQH5_9APHY|nr:hypothetical protein K466DRAFT_570977 [Polyporus arcularius HHB13444]